MQKLIHVLENSDKSIGNDMEVTVVEQIISTEVFKLRMSKKTENSHMLTALPLPNTPQRAFKSLLLPQNVVA